MKEGLLALTLAFCVGGSLLGLRSVMLLGALVGIPSIAVYFAA